MGVYKKCRRNWLVPTPPLFLTMTESISPLTNSQPSLRLRKLMLSPSGLVFAGALKDVDVTSLISNIGSGAGSAPAGGAGGAAAGCAAEEAPKEEEKKAESSEESDDDMGFGLFD